MNPDIDPIRSELAIRYIEVGAGRCNSQLCRDRVMQDKRWTHEEVEHVAHEIDAAIPAAESLSFSVVFGDISADTATAELSRRLPWMTPAAIERLRGVGDNLICH